jgi:hypothetical protein
VTIYSKYLPKIIDYGRAAFYMDQNVNSKTIYEIICRRFPTDLGTEMDGDQYVEQGKCCRYHGFGSFDKELYGNIFIDSSKINRSSDLLLIKQIDDPDMYSKTSVTHSPLIGTAWWMPYDTKYGTKERPSEYHNQEMLTTVDDVSMYLLDHYLQTISPLSNAPVWISYVIDAQDHSSTHTTAPVGYQVKGPHP